jgi:hypothetical protein
LSISILSLVFSKTDANGRCSRIRLSGVCIVDAD